MSIPKFAKSILFFILMIITTVSAQFAGGTGTSLDPYQIETPEQLNNVRNYLTSSFIMNNDIDLSDYLSPTGAGYNGGQYWEPIDGLNPFTGEFDGNNNTIYALVSKIGGLFGMVEYSTIRNLHLRKKLEIEVLNFTAATSGSLIGKVVNGNVINCSSDCNIETTANTGGLIGEVSSSTLSDSYFIGNIRTLGTTGGLVGIIDNSEVTRCYTECTIGDNFSLELVSGCGGFCFRATYRSTITECYTDSEIIGTEALAGFVVLSNWDSEYTNCYSKSIVTGESKLGGFCVATEGGEVRNCYSSGEIRNTSENYVGGFDTDFYGLYYGINFQGNGFDRVYDCYWDIESTGQLTSQDGEGKSTLRMKSPENYYDAIHHAKWDFDTPIWKIDPRKNDGYPYLAWYEPEVTFSIDGSGTETDPYQVKTPQQLDFVGDFVGDYYSPNYFKLMNDIDLTEYLSIDNPGYNDSLFWDPIGKSMSFMFRPGSRNFQAKFDGDDKKITGLKINRPDSICVGLFGKINEGAEIRNLQVFVDSSGTVLGKDSVGVIVGVNSNALIENCIASGNVQGDQLTGGLAGYNYQGDIIDSYSNAAVTGNSVVGGLVAKNESGNITRCYSKGSVSGVSDIGGLLGVNQSGINTDSYWDTETSGQSTSAGGTGLTTDEMKERLNYSNWFPSSAWEIHPLFNEGYPFLKYEEIEPYNPFALGTGISSDPFQIVTADDLELVKLYSGMFSKGKYFKLMNDIDLTDHLSMTGQGYNNGKFWDPISEPDSVFAGNFNGNSNKIRNLRINRPTEDYIGLYGYINEDAVINDLEIANYDTITITGDAFVGSIAGVSLGDLTRCSSNSDIIGNDVLGGVIGHVDGGIINECFSTGSVSGITGVGGILGYMSDGLLYDSYSTGDITGDVGIGGLIGQIVYPSVVTNCYASGSVVGNEYTGGLIGDSFYADITDCYWDIQSSGQTYSEEGIGKMTSDMTLQSNYTDWDFTSPVWSIDPSYNGGYPYLSWQSVLSYPQNLSIESIFGSNDIDFTWDAVSGADSYKIYYSTEPYGNFTLIADVSTNSWSTTVTADRYFYYVVAYNSEK